MGILFLTVTLLVTFSGPVVAKGKKSANQNIDFSSFTCSAFIGEVANSSEEDVGAVLMWLDGYLSGVSGDGVLNWKGFEQFAENLMKRCADHGDEMLLEAAKKVGIE
ncbi:MAG: hypothetical protein HQL76_15180 [Magnetococcales bacterium]|nr:hypothetical protein [Magnetococcales bacterium]